MATENGKKCPAYYFSHGGPTFMYENDPDGERNAHLKVREIGRDITSIIKPRAIVIFSAHWQGLADTIYVNSEKETELIYDFSNFPKYMYEEKYPNVGSKEIAEKIIQLLDQNKIKAVGIKRGLDHGVWVPFKVAFKPEENPLNVPIVQVSIYDNENPDMHYELGKALAPLRNENIVFIGSGMTVHNLKERYKKESDDYVMSFDTAVSKAVTLNTEVERQKALRDLLSRPDARMAHPTFDHLLPMHVVAGAAHNDKAEMLYTNYKGSFAWGQYKFFCE